MVYEQNARMGPGQKQNHLFAQRVSQEVDLIQILSRVCSVNLVCINHPLVKLHVIRVQAVCFPIPVGVLPVKSVLLDILVLEIV